MSIYHPENIDELIENAMISIGAGVIDINVSEQQAIVAAQKAIEMFCDYHYDATEHVYIAHEITNEDIENNYIETPKNVWNVIRILGRNSFPSVYGKNIGCLCCNQGGGYTVSQYPDGVNGIGELRSHFGINNAMISYYLADAHRSYFNSIINPNIGMTWNRGSKRIRIDGDIRQAVNCSQNFLIYEAYVVNEDLCFDCDNPEGNGTCFYDNQWLKEYTAARIQLIWGRNLTKFQNLNVESGFEYNGDGILQEAKENIEKLEEQLFDRYSLPAKMIIG